LAASAATTAAVGSGSKRGDCQRQMSTELDVASCYVVVVAPPYLHHYFTNAVMISAFSSRYILSTSRADSTQRGDSGSGPMHNPRLITEPF